MKSEKHIELTTVSSTFACVKLHLLCHAFPKKKMFCLERNVLSYLTKHRQQNFVDLDSAHTKRKHRIQPSSDGDDEENLPSCVSVCAFAAASHRAYNLCCVRIIYAVKKIAHV